MADKRDTVMDRVNKETNPIFKSGKKLSVQDMTAYAAKGATIPANPIAVKDKGLDSFSLEGGTFCAKDIPETKPILAPMPPRSPADPIKYFISKRGVEGSKQIRTTETADNRDPTAPTKDSPSFFESSPVIIGEKSQAMIA